MSKRFECWRNADTSDGAELTFGYEESITALRKAGLLLDDAVLLYTFDASTWFEAMSEHHRRQGWKPYDPGLLPNGEPDDSVHEPL